MITKSPNLLAIGHCRETLLGQRIPALKLLFHDKALFAQLPKRGLVCFEFWAIKAQHLPRSDKKLPKSLQNGLFILSQQCFLPIWSGISFIFPNITHYADGHQNLAKRLPHIAVRESYCTIAVLAHIFPFLTACYESKVKHGAYWLGLVCVHLAKRGKEAVREKGMILTQLMRWHIDSVIAVVEDKGNTDEQDESTTLSEIRCGYICSLLCSISCTWRSWT